MAEWPDVISSDRQELLTSSHIVLVCQSPYNELKFQQTTMLRNYIATPDAPFDIHKWHAWNTLLQRFEEQNTQTC